MSKYEKQIIIKVPDQMFDQISNVSKALGKTKSAFLRQAIIRNVNFVLEVELPRLKQDTVRFKEHLSPTWSVRR